MLRIPTQIKGLGAAGSGVPRAGASPQRTPNLREGVLCPEVVAKRAGAAPVSEAFRPLRSVSAAGSGGRTCFFPRSAPRGYSARAEAMGKAARHLQEGKKGGKKTPKPKNQTKPKPKPNPLSSKGPWATGVSSTAPVRARGVPLYLRACKNIPNSALSPGGCGGFGVWFGFGVCFLVLGFFLPQTAAFSPPRSTASTKYNCDG